MAHRIPHPTIHLVALLALAGCAARYKEVSGPELMANKRVDPLDVTLYEGSDKDYDYFDRVAFKTHVRLKVKRGGVAVPHGLKPGDAAVWVDLAKPTTNP